MLLYKYLIHGVLVAALVLFITACQSQTAVFSSMHAQRSAPTNTPTNILLVIADDFGLDASPCYDIGKDKPDMPTLQALCQKGVVFDQAWAYPVCTPTRASILSGLHGFRTGARTVDDVLPPMQTLLHAMQKAGYATAVVGKWHVGGKQSALDHPNQMGAHYYAGFLSGALSDYADWRMVINGREQAQTGYATSVLTDQAIAWTLQQQRQPWFLWLAYNAPHAPFHVPPAHLHTSTTLKKSGTKDQSTSTREEVRAMYFAMAQALDHELGRLLESLPAAMRDNTVVIFLGDNGTPGRVAQSPYTRERVKGTVYEGGVRVPLVIAGAGVTRMGERDSALITSTDLFATVLALALAPPTPRADSVNFAAALTQKNFSGRTFALTESHNKDGVTSVAVRDPQYKLIEHSNAAPELYDLLADPFEQRNLLTGTAMPAIAHKASALRGLLQQQGWANTAR
jgi:arylsulfatase A-like enzyme